MKSGSIRKSYAGVTVCDVAGGRFQDKEMKKFAMENENEVL